MIEIELPDGTIAEFPEGTSNDAIKSALAKRFKPAPKQDQLETAARSAFQGFTFGFGDEIVAGAAAPIRVAMDVARRGTDALSLENLQRQYEGGLDLERQWMQEGREANPGTAIVSEIGGAIANPVARKLPSESVKDLAVGGAKLGAVYGAGTGEGMEGRAVGAVRDAAMGAGVGAATRPIVAAATKAGGAVAAPVLGALGIGDERRALQFMANAARRSGKSQDEIMAELEAAVREGQPEFMMADAMGNAGQRALSGVTRQPNDMRQEIVEQLYRRQAGQGERLAAALDEALPGPSVGNAPAPIRNASQRPGARPQPVLPSRTAEGAKQTLGAARDARANAQYAAARAGAEPVDIRGVIGVIDQRLNATKGQEWARNSVDKEFAKIRSQLIRETEDGTVAVSDIGRLIKFKSEELADRISELYRQGKGGAAKALEEVRDALDAALEQSSAAYRAANDDFARASAVIDQVDVGRAAAGSRVRADDVEAMFRAMTPEQQAAFRAGYADDVVGRVEAAAAGSNKARPLTSPKRQQELAALPPTKAAREKIARQIQRENTMFETAQAAMGGSRTADNMADIADVKGVPVGMIANLLQGRLMTAVGDAAQGAGRFLSGKNQGTVERIAKALMSTGRQAQKVLRDASEEELRQAIALALRARGLTAAGVSAQPGELAYPLQ